MGSQRAGHNLVVEEQQNYGCSKESDCNMCLSVCYIYIYIHTIYIYLCYIYIFKKKCKMLRLG